MSRRQLPPKTRSNKSQDRLRSEGAEFLVLGNLLIRDIHATKAYTNFPGWDVLAVNSMTGKQARIQVKSRWATDSGNFLVKNFECDFVVLCYLNRGFNFGKRGQTGGLQEPSFWIFPTQYLLKLVKSGKTSGNWAESVSFRKNKMQDQGESFKNNWDLISEFLKN